MEQSQETSRQLLSRWWSEAWEGGLWAAPWKRALEGLNAQQAAWRSAEGRHSIWELVNHVCFWREHELRKLAGETVTKEEIQRRNFEPPADTSESAWSAARGRFEETHRAIGQVLGDASKDVARVQYLVPHDSYHIGQMMTLRAMQGMPPIE